MHDRKDDAGMHPPTRSSLYTLLTRLYSYCKKKNRDHAAVSQQYPAEIGTRITSIGIPGMLVLLISILGGCSIITVTISISIKIDIQIDTAAWH